MKNETFFAPLVRGMFIEKARQPWIVSLAGEAQGPQGKEVELTAVLDAVEDESAAGASLTMTFMDTPFFKGNRIPLRVRVKADGAEYVFLTAPDYEGIERIRRGERTTPWDLNDASLPGDPQGTYGASRARVIDRRVAVVTGGAQGFGEEIARGLVSAGAIVYIADLNLQGAEKVAASLNEEYRRTVAFAVAVNVGEEDSVRVMLETVARTTGGLDLCVSNAGVLRAAPILEQDISAFKFVTDINYVAFATITKYCGLLMKTQHAAAPSWTTDIIQINSKSGLEGSNKNGAYAGSKFGGIGLVQSFAKELVDYDIKVNAVCPGNFFDGPLWSDPEKGLFVQYLRTGKVPGAKTIADVKAFYEAKVPMGRGCTGPDVIRAVLYLVEQVYETGQALPVTGGQVMLN